MAKGNWRDDLSSTLRSIYDTKGMADFLGVAKALLQTDGGRGRQYGAQLSGEVCEIVFNVITDSYIKSKGVEGSLYSSVVLKDLQDPSSSFRTELDSVLVTPYFLLTTECKSYRGDIVFTDKCSLAHKGDSKITDIWKQNLLHYKHLCLYGNRLCLPNLGLSKLPIFANVFIFSNAQVEDLRTDEYKRVMRVLSLSSLYKFYDELFSRYKTVVFNYDYACKVFKTCSESVVLHEQHGKYLGYC